MVWCVGVLWCGVMLNGVEVGVSQCEGVWCGMVWYGVVLWGMALELWEVGVVWHGMVWRVKFYKVGLLVECDSMWMVL